MPRLETIRYLGILLTSSKISLKQALTDLCIVRYCEAIHPQELQQRH